MGALQLGKSRPRPNQGVQMRSATHPNADSPRRRGFATMRTHDLLALSATVFALTAACGPMYVQGRDDCYYHAQTPQPGVQQPVAPAPQAQQSDDPRVIFADLNGHGTWRWVQPYGWVWVPASNAVQGWRPYYYGQWQYTTYGWTWASD